PLVVSAPVLVALTGGPVTPSALLLDEPSKVVVAVVPSLEGVGTPEVPGEGVVGALAGGGGWPGAALTMSSPNWSGGVSRPRVSMGSSNGCVRREGCCPRAPAGASRFCWRMALATSVAVVLSAASFCGSSQTRML